MANPRRARTRTKKKKKQDSLRLIYKTIEDKEQDQQEPGGSGFECQQMRFEFKD